MQNIRLTVIYKLKINLISRFEAKNTVLNLDNEFKCVNEYSF